MKEDCEKGGFKKINLLTEDQIENLKLRCEGIEIDESTVICKRHTDKYITRYPLHQKSCCDPFTQHKKRVTSKCCCIFNSKLFDGLF